MKALGGLLLAVSGLIWGLSRSGELHSRVERLTELLSLIRILKAEVCYSARPIGELLCRSSCKLCKLAAERWDFHANPAEALLEAGKSLYSRREDLNLLAGFTQGLGVSDTQGTLEHLDLYTGLIQARLEEAQAELSKKQRLYPALGLCTALVVAVILF